MNYYTVCYYGNSDGGVASILLEAESREEAKTLIQYHPYFEQLICVDVDSPSEWEAARAREESARLRKNIRRAELLAPAYGIGATVSTNPEEK